MSPILRLWSASTLILATMMITSAWLPGGSISVLYSRLALGAAASACLLLVIRRWWRSAVPAHTEERARTREKDAVPKPEMSSGRQTSTGSVPELAWRRDELSGKLVLAADHLESIKTLLEVSQSHQQPIPRAAFHNLELVSKNLRSIERQFSGATRQDTQSASVLQFR